MQAPLLGPRLGANTVAIEGGGLSRRADFWHWGGHVVAENAIDLLPVLRERQSQPKQYDMIAALSRAFHHAMERNAPLCHAVMSAAPIGGGVAGKDVGGAKSRDLLSVNLEEPRAREPERGLRRARP